MKNNKSNRQKVIDYILGLLEEGSDVQLARVAEDVSLSIGDCAPCEVCVANTEETERLGCNEFCCERVADFINREE